MKIKQISLCISSILLCGCALLGPKYKKPDVTTPNKWQESATSTIINRNSVDVAKNPWWKKFNDQNLNNLMEEALANNNDIQSAIGNITVAAGNLQQVKMAWVPTLSAGGTYGIGQTFNTQNSTNLQLPPGTSFSNNSGNDFSFYSYGLIPSYSINVFQQIKKQDVANTNLELAKANKDAVRLAIISQVSGSYFTLLALNSEIANQRSLVTHLSQLLNMVKIQHKYGLVTQSDVVAAQQRLSQAKMQLPNMEHNLVVTQNAMQVLINNNSKKIGSTTEFSKIKIDGMIPVSLPSTVLESRPDIRISEYQLKIANDNIGVAKSNFFPKINLTTPIGAYSSQLGNLFNTSGDFWTAQITATMPILNLGLYGLIKQTKGQYYISYYNYIRTVKGAFADVNNNLSGYEKIQQSYTEALVNYDSADSIAKLNQQNYKNGYISNQDNISSQINADNAKILLDQTKLQQLQAIISLYQSLAAGYDYKNTNAPKEFGDDHDA
ncbi:MAG: efflux transporter outer membrane subunit [Neisseriaceae bacterium]